MLSATCGVLSGTPGSGQKLVEYFPLLEEGLRLATHAPEHVVLLQRTRETVPEGPKIDFSRGIADKRSNFREWGKVLANVPAGFIMILFAADDTKGVVGAIDYSQVREAFVKMDHYSRCTMFIVVGPLRDHTCVQ